MDAERQTNLLMVPLDNFLLEPPVDLVPVVNVKRTSEIATDLIHEVLRNLGNGKVAS